jgi:hypothetical protein
LIDQDGKETAIFSGDTFLLVMWERPDLAQKSSFHDSGTISRNIVSFAKRQNHDLPDDVIVYLMVPVVLVVNMSKETVSTIGNQKENNYAESRYD